MTARTHPIYVTWQEEQIIQARLIAARNASSEAPQHFAFGPALSQQDARRCQAAYARWMRVEKLLARAYDPSSPMYDPDYDGIE